MSTPGNTAKLGIARCNAQTAQSCPSLVVIDPIQCISHHTTESAHYPTMLARHKIHISIIIAIYYLFMITFALKYYIMEWCFN